MKKLFTVRFLAICAMVCVFVSCASNAPPQENTTYDIHYELGKIHYELGNKAFNNRKWQRAVAEYDWAIEENPNNKEAYHQRGRTYYYTGSLKKAQADFSEALSIDTSFLPAKLYLQNTNVPEAAYKLYLQGIAAHDEKNYDHAIEYFTKAIGLAPKYELAYLERSAVFLDQKDFPAIERDLNTVITINPKNFYAYSYLGSMLYDLQKNYIKAEQYLNQALALYPDYTFAKDLLEKVTEKAVAERRLNWEQLKKTVGAKSIGNLQVNGAYYFSSGFTIHNQIGYNEYSASESGTVFDDFVVMDTNFDLSSEVRIGENIMQYLGTTEVITRAGFVRIIPQFKLLYVYTIHYPRNGKTVDYLGWTGDKPQKRETKTINTLILHFSGTPARR